MEGGGHRATVADMARFHTAHGGRHWVTGSGTPENPDDLDFLMPNTVPIALPTRIEAPAILTIVPDEDDRVAPWHGYKMHAAWLAANVSKSPILFSARHGRDAGAAPQSAEPSPAMPISGRFFSGS